MECTGVPTVRGYSHRLIEGSRYCGTPGLQVQQLSLDRALQGALKGLQQGKVGNSNELLKGVLALSFDRLGEAAKSMLLDVVSVLAGENNSCNGSVGCVAWCSSHRCIQSTSQPRSQQQSMAAGVALVQVQARSGAEGARRHRVSRPQHAAGCCPPKSLWCPRADGIWQCDPPVGVLIARLCMPAARTCGPQLCLVMAQCFDASTRHHSATAQH